MDALKPLDVVTSPGRDYDVLLNLMNVVGLKDQATLKHSNRVYDLTLEWASHMRRRWMWSEINVETLTLAALLHDIGKIAVLDEILLKPSSLDANERAQLEQHSEIGYQMIRDFPKVSDIAMGVRHHHERWDGKGYPLGLKEKQIPLFAQIICIVDAFDAMTSDRPYRKAMSNFEALKEIKNEAGRQFSPELATQFVEFMHANNT